jgi:hypothetical protein
MQEDLRMSAGQLAPATRPESDENVWSEKVDDEPNRWRAWFVTPANTTPRTCGHRHHSEHAALACGDARRRALSREERWR